MTQTIVAVGGIGAGIHPGPTDDMSAITGVGALHVLTVADSVTVAAAVIVLPDGRITVMVFYTPTFTLDQV